MFSNLNQTYSESSNYQNWSHWRKKSWNLSFQQTGRRCKIQSVNWSGKSVVKIFQHSPRTLLRREKYCWFWFYCLWWLLSFPFIAVSKESGTGSGLSSQSSSSGVLVPGVDDKDVDWADDDLDLNDDDMTEEEVKLIMQNIAASSKEKAQDQEGGDLDVSLMSPFSVLSSCSNDNHFLANKALNWKVVHSPVAEQQPLRHFPHRCVQHHSSCHSKAQVNQ